MSPHLSPRSLLVLAAVAIGLSCGSKTATNPSPPPDPVPNLSLACPGNVLVDTDKTPYVVSYSQPLATGGVAPIQTSCTINSGASLGAGSTDVICTATDTSQRRAQCTFNVTINLVRRLKGTRFLAFGDSITQGEVSQPNISVHAVEPENSYPTALQSMLRERYLLQKDQIVVVNAGLGGQHVAEDEDRFVEAVISAKPDVVLLLEGANDVNDGAGQLDPGSVVRSLRLDVVRALRNNAKLVLVSTLLPQVEGGNKAGYPDGVELVNDEIRRRIPAEGGKVVDSYAVFKPMQNLLIGVDGLHPTVAGYKTLAETFLKAISDTFEEPPAAGASPAPSSMLRRPARR